MKITNLPYEAPQTEVIEIKCQGILCSSGGGAPSNPTTTNFTGDGGVQFGTDGGSW